MSESRAGGQAGKRTLAKGARDARERALDDIREAAWQVIIANQPVLRGTPEDELYHLLCLFGATWSK